MKCGRCLHGHLLPIGKVESTEVGKQDDLYWCRNCGTLVHWNTITKQWEEDQPGQTSDKFVPVLERVPHDARERYTGEVKLEPIDVPTSARIAAEGRQGQ